MNLTINMVITAWKTKKIPIFKNSMATPKTILPYIFILFILFYLWNICQSYRFPTMVHLVQFSIQLDSDGGVCTLSILLDSCTGSEKIFQRWPDHSLYLKLQSEFPFPCTPCFIFSISKIWHTLILFTNFVSLH